jgi:hypothetical protein
MTQTKPNRNKDIHIRIFSFEVSAFILVKRGGTQEFESMDVFSDISLRITSYHCIADTFEMH